MPRKTSVAKEPKMSLEDRAVKFHYQWNRYSQAVKSYEDQIANIQIGKHKRKQIEEYCQDTKKIDLFVAASEKMVVEKLADVVDSFKQIKELLTD